MNTPQRIKHALSITALAGLLQAAPAHADWVDVLRENFNDVNGINAAGGVRTVTDILANTPGQLASGTSQIRAGDSPNVRRADNEINTNGGATGFDGFFRSKFLVLGDDRGGIGGSPTGGGEDTGLIIPFHIPAFSTHLRVSFDYAFDGVDSSVNKTDHLSLALLFGGHVVSVARFSSDTDLGQSDHIDSFFDIFADLDPANLDYELRIRLNETNNGGTGGTTNTAAGIDNIRISARVPEPASLVLLLTGLAGLAAKRQQRRLKPS